MNELNKNQVGLTLGLFAVIMHAAWEILVFLGVGQALMDWGYSLHFLRSSMAVESFSFGGAIFLLAVAFVFFYCVGFIFAAVWNAVAKK